MGTNQGTPWDEDALAGESSQGADEAERLPTRVARYSTAKYRATRMVEYLASLPADADDFDQARRAWTKLKECGNYLHFHLYYTVGKVRLAAACFCKQHLICPLCAIRRGAKTLQAYLDRFAVIQADHSELSPFLITFTVRNGDDLAERFGHLQGSFKVLQKRRHRWLSGVRGVAYTEFAKIQGAVGTYETTNKGKGWHPHIHMVALAASEPSQAALKAEWEAITGDSFMVDVRPFKTGQDPAEGFMEVMKYAVKFGELSLSDNWHAAKLFAGKRLLFSFGLFRGVKVPEALTDEPLEGLPYIDLFYRWLGVAGYSLTGESPDRELTTDTTVTTNNPYQYYDPEPERAKSPKRATAKG